VSNAGFVTERREVPGSIPELTGYHHGGGMYEAVHEGSIKLVCVYMHAAGKLHYRVNIHLACTTNII
jgi:hypothetical protein